MELILIKASSLYVNELIVKFTVTKINNFTCYFALAVFLKFDQLFKLIDYFSMMFQMIYMHYLEYAKMY